MDILSIISALVPYVLIIATIAFIVWIIRLLLSTSKKIDSLPDKRK